MSIVSGLVYTMKSRATGYGLDGNKIGRLYPHPFNGHHYQKWVIEHVSGVYYKLKHIASNRYLDGNIKGRIYSHPWNGGDYQLWKIQYRDNGCYSFIQKATNRALDGNKDRLYSLIWNGGNYQKWKVEPSSIEWRSDMRKLEYGNYSNPVGDNIVLLVTDMYYTNNSDVEQTFVVELDKEIAKYVSYRLFQGLNINSKTTVRASFLGIISGETGFEVDWKKEETWQYSSTENVLISVDIPVVIPPRKAIEVDSEVKIQRDFAVPFTLICKVRAKCLTKNLNGEELETLLKTFYHPTCEIVSKEANAVLVKINGEYIGDYAVSINTELTQHDIEDLKKHRQELPLPIQKKTRLTRQRLPIQKTPNK